MAVRIRWSRTTIASALLLQLGSPLVGSAVVGRDGRGEVFDRRRQPLPAVVRSLADNEFAADRVLIVGSMPPNQIAFYATAATVIPVFLVAYAVRMTKGFGIEIEKLLGREAVQKFIDDMDAAFSNANRRLSVARVFAGASLRLVVLLVRNLALAVCVGAPVIAEWGALYVLSRGHASSGDMAVVWIGLAAAALYFVAPAAYAYFARPVLALIRAFIQGTLILERSTSGDEKGLETLERWEETLERWISGEPKERDERKSRE